MSDSTLPELYNSSIGEYIAPKNSLFKDVKYKQIVDHIVHDLKQIPNFHKRRFDSEFILRACNFIENLITKKDKMNKLELLVDVFVQIFNINDDEIKTLQSTVSFLCDRKLIKKISRIKWVRKFVVKVVSRQLFF